MPILKRSEKSIQKAVVDYARKKGAIAIKLSTAGMMGTAGWPDYLYLYEGKLVFHEYKRPGGKLTLLQAMRIHDLIEQRFVVTVCDDVDEAKRDLNYRFGWRHT